ENFQEIQRDTHVTQADHLLPSVFAFSFSNPKSVLAKHVLERWDRTASRDSAGALIFTIFLVELNRILAGATLKSTLPVYLALSTPLYSAVDGALEKGSAPRLLAAAGFASGGLGAACEEALARSFDVATEACGKNPARWQLGKLHTYLFAYSGAKSHAARWLLNRGPYPAPGTSTTVNVSMMNPANARPRGGSVITGAGPIRRLLERRQAEYRTVAAPSMRFTASLADPDRTFIMAPMGQSGRPGNRHYDDMIQKWIECEVVPLPLSRRGAESVARERFTLHADSASAR
ncbi:MAG TPA: penicillin acylase family protein, partial [Spirochaetia bacterium]|nr:penicillin acylase family protein [Spirochaetia bacterium]